MRKPLSRLREQSAQATLEWLGATLVLALTLGAAAVVGGERVDGLRFATGFARHLVCAISGSDCDRGDGALRRAYGSEVAELVRGHAPGLVYRARERSLANTPHLPSGLRGRHQAQELDFPVDWRSCRRPACARLQTAGGAVSRTSHGRPIVAFVRVRRVAARLYVQYWLYYPDSRTRTLVDPIFGAFGRPGPGYHADDWEAYELKFERDGRVYARASHHGDWFPCRLGTFDKARQIIRDELPRAIPLPGLRAVTQRLPAVRRSCVRWLPYGGWTQVDEGSHANTLDPQGRPVRAREGTFVAPADIVLVPIDRNPRSRAGYRAHGPVDPPWRKEVFDDPEAPDS